MSDQTTTQSPEQARQKKMPKKPPKEKRERLAPGTLPPFLTLTQAFELAKLVNDQGGGRANSDLMSEITGNSSSSSNYIKKMNALKTYGLVSQDGDVVLLTELGIDVAAPRSPEAGAQAKKDAFLKIENFKQLYERHKGKLLPDSQFLRNIIEQDLRVNKEFSQGWMNAFKDGLTAAGLALPRPDGKIQIRELGTVGVQSNAPLGKPVEQVAAQKVQREEETPNPDAIPIALARDRIARLLLPQQWNPTDLPRLLQMICLSVGEGMYSVKVTKAEEVSPASPEQS